MFALIQNNPYIVLLIATIVEWPIATFVSAWLAAHHILRLEYVVGVSILGDVLGDFFLYCLWRYGYNLKIVKRIVNTIPRKERLVKSLKKNTFLYFVIAKFTPYLATPTLIFAGIERISPISFTWYAIILSILVKSLYITLGYIGAVSIKQLESFLIGRETIIVYIIWSIVLLKIAYIGYQHLWRFLKKKLK